jgi:hypothetical protein
VKNTNWVWTNCLSLCANEQKVTVQTVTESVPGSICGVVAVSDLGLRTVNPESWSRGNPMESSTYSRKPPALGRAALNPRPVMVMAVPPVAGPAWGLTVSTRGMPA